MTVSNQPINADYAILAQIQAYAPHWIDLLWLPVTLFVVHTGQRLGAAAFVMICLLVLRLQVEVIESIGFNTGFTGWIDAPAKMRGMIVYSVFIMLFLVLAYFSPATKGAIFLAACLSLFFMAFAASTIIMVI